MRSWEAQRTLRGSDGSWKILRGLRSTEAVFSGPEAVLRGSRRVLMGPVGLMGTERYWGIKGFARFLRDQKGSERSWRVLQGYDGPLMKYLHPSNPYDFSRTLRALQHPSNPTGFLRTCWTPGPPRNIRTPQNNVRTPSGPLQELWIPPQNSWDPSELFRTHQNPLGSFEPLGIPYYNLLKNNILCYKMLVFNLHVLHSLSNILAYI